jgi:hypothetical protein
VQAPWPRPCRRRAWCRREKSAYLALVGRLRSNPDAREATTGRPDGLRKGNARLSLFRHRLDGSADQNVVHAIPPPRSRWRCRGRSSPLRAFSRAFLAATGIQYPSGNRGRGLIKIADRPWTGCYVGLNGGGGASGTKPTCNWRSLTATRCCNGLNVPSPCKVAAPFEPDTRTRATGWTGRGERAGN